MNSSISLSLSCSGSRPALAEVTKILSWPPNLGEEVISQGVDFCQVWALVGASCYLHWDEVGQMEHSTLLPPSVKTKSLGGKGRHRGRVYSDVGLVPLAS